MVFVTDKKLDDEISYWVEELGWNKGGDELVVDKKYVIVFDKNHDECCGSGQCERCSENQTRHYQIVKISPLKSKEVLVFERVSRDQLGELYSNWYCRGVQPLTKSFYKTENKCLSA